MVQEKSYRLGFGGELSVVNIRNGNRGIRDGRSRGGLFFLPFIYNLQFTIPDSFSFNVADFPPMRWGRRCAPTTPGSRRKPINSGKGMGSRASRLWIVDRGSWIVDCGLWMDHLFFYLRSPIFNPLSLLLRSSPAPNNNPASAVFGSGTAVKVSEEPLVVK